jgi:hypothetical protein
VDGRRFTNVCEEAGAGDFELQEGVCDLVVPIELELGRVDGSSGRGRTSQAV